MLRTGYLLKKDYAQWSLMDSYGLWRHVCWVEIDRCCRGAWCLCIQLERYPEDEDSRWFCRFHAFLQDFISQLRRLGSSVLSFLNKPYTCAGYSAEFWDVEDIWPGVLWCTVLLKCVDCTEPTDNWSSKFFRFEVLCYHLHQSKVPNIQTCCAVKVTSEATTGLRDLGFK